MNNIEDYQFYKYCKICGEIISEEVYDDNDGLCDFCYMNYKTWEDYPVGSIGY